jgi:hypothetical protein
LGGGRVLWGLAFGVEKIDQIFDLIWLESVAESGHSSAAVLDLILDFFFAQAFADSAEVRA